MSKFTFVISVAIGLFYACTPQAVEPAQEVQEPAHRQLYQLKVYSFDSDEQVQITDDYLSKAFLPALKRQQIGSVGVFKLRPETAEGQKKTYVLIPFSSFSSFHGLEDRLSEDVAYLEAGELYLSAANDQAPYARVESIIMEAFEDMAQMTTPAFDNPREDRVYELRSYESPNETYYANKLDMFNAGGEIILFDRLEFNAVFYGDVLSGSKMPNLMYMTTFADQTSRDAHWKAFVDSPEWKALVAMEKYKNNVSHADLIFLYPTDYSDY